MRRPNLIAATTVVAVLLAILSEATAVQASGPAKPRAETKLAARYPIRIRSRSRNARSIPQAATKTAATPAHRLASVKIGGCSGTIIKIDGKYAYGISVSHCCSGVGDSFWFDNPDGKTGGNARWIADDPSVDMALFRCWSKNVLGAAKVCKFLPDWTLRAEAIGYPRRSGGPAHKKLTYLRTVGQRIRRRTVDRYSFRNDGPGYDGGGDSGGGIFYGGGFLVGVHSHGPRIRSSSAPQVIAFLKRNRFLGISLFCASGECPPGWHRPTYPVVVKPTQDPAIADLKKRVADLKAENADFKKVLDKLHSAMNRIKTTPGPEGKAGPRGEAGSAGRGVKSVSIGEDGVLSVLLTDDTVVLVGRVRGKDGQPGKVDVVIAVDGKEVQRADKVESGKTVEVPIRRFLKGKPGSKANGTD